MDDTSSAVAAKALKKDASIAGRKSLAIALLRARESVMSNFRPILTEHDVTEQQWRVVRVLYEADTLDATDAADRASILAPSLTRIIRSLEDRKLITKRRDESDGRRTLLSITPAGRVLVESVMPASNRIYAGIDEKFGRERVEMLLTLLNEISDLKLDTPTSELE